MKESIILTKQPLLRRIASRGFNILIRTVLNLQYKDTQAGAKIFKKQAIDSILPEISASGWAFDVHLLYKIKKKNYTIKEIPIEWRDTKESKLKMRKAIPKMFLSVIKTRLGK
jgi:dolichol-phosphate mannosyltransferase